MARLHKSLSNLETIRRWKNGEKTDIKIFTNISEREKFRNNGDEWELKGIKYKKENGKTIKLHKTQGDLIREMIDDRCNECNCQVKWGSNRDISLFRRTGLCEECLVTYETKLRVLGIWDNYEKYKLASYALGDLNNNKIRLIEIINYFKTNDGDVILPNEDGGIDETWKNINKDVLVKDVKEDLKKVKKFIKEASIVKIQNKKLYISKCKQFKLKVI